MKKRILSILLSLSMIVVSTATFGAEETTGTVETQCQLSAEKIGIGDTLYADYKVTENNTGFNNMTGFVYFDPTVLEAVDIDYTEMPVDLIEYNQIPLFPSNVVSSRVDFVPKSHDTDYNAKADGKTNAGKLGILKFSGYCSSSVDGYLQNYTSTGTVIRIKFKAVGNGVSDVSFDKFSGTALKTGKSIPLTIKSASSSVSVEGNDNSGSVETTTSATETTTTATTESGTETTTAKQSSGGGGGGGSSSSKATTTTVTTTETTETTTQSVSAEDSTETTTEKVSAQKFTDIEDDYWGAKYINQLADKGIINGYKDGSFLPNNEIKRADFIIMLLKGVGVDITNTPSSNFSDIEKGAYYYNAVGQAKALGIANGNGDGTFSPDSNITRQDMMILAKKALVYKLGKDIVSNDTNNLLSFDDYSEISQYALDSLSIMVKEGLINGMDGKIAPKATTTRAQAATVIYKIMNYK